MSLYRKESSGALLEPSALLPMTTSRIPADVSTVFDSYPESIKGRLLEIRELILRTAGETDGVGTVVEGLRWGQPSYLTPETGSGTTIRLGPVNGSDEKVGLFVHCQTTLVETYRQMYPDLFKYSGTRAILIDVDSGLHEGPLCHCIALALRYHLDKQSAAR